MRQEDIDYSKNKAKESTDKIKQGFDLIEEGMNVVWKDKVGRSGRLLLVGVAKENMRLKY